MRIIAGEHRGRRLLAPESDTTRPITDRAKQSLFDVITPWIDGARVYDCFAGTGSMGLECLSRGAAHATFFERDRSAVTRLKQNIDTLRVADRCTVIPADLFRHFAGAPQPEPRIDLIFLDPPYRFLNDQPNDLRALATHLARHLAVDGLILFRHDTTDRLSLPDLSVARTLTYGSMTIEILRPTAQ